MTMQEFVTQLLAHMGVSSPTVDIAEGNDTLQITIRVGEEDSGLLIGRHGETVESIQSIVRLIYQKDAAKPVVVNINDFREHRAEHIKEIADRVAERVRETQQPQYLHLPANERRIVHMHLAEAADLTTESEGEGINRVLVVKPKTE